MNFARFYTLSAVSVLSLALTACGVGEAVEAPTGPPAPEVTVAAVQMQNLRDWADFTGRLEAVDTVEIRARVSGVVESVNFDEGGPVGKGDLLFQIDPRPFKAQVDRLEAERQRARAELKLARSHRDRAERLLAQNATSEEEFEEFSSAAAVAEARLAGVEAELDAAQLDLSFTRVTSPIAGRVSRAIVTAGNLVDSSTALTTVVSLNPVFAYFDVDEQTYLEHVRASEAGQGAQVFVGFIDETGHPHAGKLDFVDNRVDPEHGTIRARAVLDNSDGGFTPGLFVRLKFVSPQSYPAALVDDRAIGTDLGRKFVLVVDENDIAQYRAVETGRLIDGYRVVTDGLAAGDEIVVNGLQRVRPGSVVAPMQAAAPAAPADIPDYILGEPASEALAKNTP